MGELWKGEEKPRDRRQSLPVRFVFLVAESEKSGQISEYIWVQPAPKTPRARKHIAAKKEKQCLGSFVRKDDNSSGIPNGLT